MKIRVMAVIFFDDEATARKILEKIPKPVKKLFGDDDSYVSIHKCFHDESPPKPCELIKEWRPSE